MRTPLSDLADARIRQALAPYPQMFNAEVVAIGTGADTGKVKVRLPGEDSVATADLPFAPVIGTVPALNARVLVLADFASRRVVSGSGGGSSQAIGAFSAYMATSQDNITTSSDTKVQYNAEDFDVSGWYDHVTNFRYTPQLAGFYRLSAFTNIAPGVSGTFARSQIWKNGADYARLGQSHGASTSAIGVSGSVVVQANGTTDYFEVFLWHNLGVNTSDISASSTLKFTGEYIGTA